MTLDTPDDALAVLCAQVRILLGLGPGEELENGDLLFYVDADDGVGGLDLMRLYAALLVIERSYSRNRVG